MRTVNIMSKTEHGLVTLRGFIDKLHFFRECESFWLLEHSLELGRLELLTTQGKKYGASSSQTAVVESQSCLPDDANLIGKRSSLKPIGMVPMTGKGIRIWFTWT